MDSNLTTATVSTEASPTDIMEEIVQGRVKARQEREAQREREHKLEPALLAALDSVGEAVPSTKTKWKKPRNQKKEPKPLRNNIPHLTIYPCHHRNQDCWSKVAILSEIDCLMKTNNGPCYASVEHLASVGKVVWGTAQNYITEWEENGVIIGFGYHGRTKNRIIAPAHSNFPALSRRILNEFKNRNTDDIPY